MPRPASATVATPGVPTTESGETDADALTSAAADLDDGAAASKPAIGKIVKLTQEQLQAMLNQAAAQGAAAVHRASTSTRAPQPELPTQAEVLAGIADGSIRVPTLSKDGYVVPPNYGEPANAAIKR